MKKKSKKKIIISAISISLAIILLIPASYLLYVVFSYYRVEDYQELEISEQSALPTPVGRELTLTTYNIGFGAYSQDYSFFMDGGKYSRAYSKQTVIDNTTGALASVKELNPDFALFQEVDVDGDRSYGVDQTELLAKGFNDYNKIFAQNYDSPYFLYPFSQPIGANKSGITTFSKYKITGAIRRSLPIENSLYKYLDLDRAYSVSRIEVAGGKTLVLYNAHLSAYTSDGTISDEQLKMLCQDMQAEFEKGNYAIAAGDFNKDMLGDSSKYFERADGEFTWAKPLNTDLLTANIKAYSGSNAPSCRNADSPFRNDGTDFVLSVDGALVSDNVEVLSSETLDLAFKFSDHNPVVLKFMLKD